MTLFNRTLTLALSALAFVTLPACDTEQYESLGVAIEDIDSMSEEELDELAALEDELDLSDAVDPGDPDDLAAGASAGRPGTVDTLWTHPHTHGATRPGATDTLWTHPHTHDGAGRPGTVDGLWNGPFDTHGVAGPATLGEPSSPRPGTVDGLTTPPPPPTHAGAGVVAGLGLPDEGCDTHGEDPILAANI